MYMLSYGAVVKIYYKVNTLCRTQRISAIVIVSSSRVRILSCSWHRSAPWLDGKLLIQPVLWMSVPLLIFGHLSYTRSPFNLPGALIRCTALRRTSLLSFCSSVEHPRQGTYSTQRVLISFQPWGYFFRVKIVMEKHRLTNGLRRRGQ